MTTSALCLVISRWCQSAWSRCLPPRWTVRPRSRMMVTSAFWTRPVWSVRVVFSCLVHLCGTANIRVQWPKCLRALYCRTWLFRVFTSETLVVCHLLWNLLFPFCFGWGWFVLRRVCVQTCLPLRFRHNSYGFRPQILLLRWLGQKLRSPSDFSFPAF